MLSNVFASPTARPYPRSRLAAALALPGGVCAVQARLEAIIADCLDEVDRLLDLLDTAWVEVKAAPTALGLRRIYARSSELIGVAAAAGLPGLDRAAYSLCDLLDRIDLNEAEMAAGVARHLPTLHRLRADKVGHDPDLTAEALQDLRAA